MDVFQIQGRKLQPECLCGCFRYKTIWEKIFIQLNHVGKKKRILTENLLDCLSKIIFLKNTPK